MLNYSEKVNVELTLILLKTRICVQYNHTSDTFIICIRVVKWKGKTLQGSIFMQTHPPYDKCPMRIN